MLVNNLTDSDICIAIKTTFTCTCLHPQILMYLLYFIMSTFCGVIHVLESGNCLLQLILD